MSTGGDAAALFAQAMQAAQGDALRGVEARIDARIREIAAQIEATTKPEDIAASVGEAIEALRCELPAIVAAHAGVDALKLADAARAALLAEIGLPGSKVGALASGDADLLPALRSPDPAYVQTETGRAIRYGLAKGARFIIVSGPSGSGKTFPAEQELRALGRRYLKLSGGDGLTRGDLIGRQEAANGATHWRAGTYPQALRHGLAVIHDEIDRTDGLVLAGLNHVKARTSKPALQVYVDVSGSMSGSLSGGVFTGEKPAARPAGAAAFAIAHAARSAGIARQVLAFTTEPMMLADWTESLELGSLATGYTSLPNALLSGLPRLASRPEGRRIALVLIDGDCGSPGDWQRILGLSRASGIELYAIGIGVDPFIPDPTDYPKQLEWSRSPFGLRIPWTGALRLDDVADLPHRASQELIAVLARGGAA
jgi:hypothetical protein